MDTTGVTTGETVLEVCSVEGTTTNERCVGITMELTHWTGFSGVTGTVTVATTTTGTSMVSVSLSLLFGYLAILWMKDE